MKSFTTIMKNHLKQLTKAYNKRLTKVNGIEHFIEYLKYLRDTAIIKAESAKALENDSKVITLITAVSEFEAYKNSKDEKQRKFHWNNFCEFVKLNMEEWQVFNDSI